jgi:hypothetical protein
MSGIITRKDKDDESIRHYKVINHIIWKDKFIPLIEYSHTDVSNIYKLVTRKKIN